MAPADSGNPDGRARQGSEKHRNGQTRHLDQEARGADPQCPEDRCHGGPLLEVLRLR